MTSSYLNEMYDVTGVNVFLSKLMKFPPQKKVNSVPSPLLQFHSNATTKLSKYVGRLFTQDLA